MRGRIYKVVFGVFTIVVLLLACRFFAPKFIIESGVSISQELNFVAALGTIVGGIMAAAGIIITLVSVFSYISLDRRIEQKFNELVKQKQLEQRDQSQRMLQGFALQLQSLSTNDLIKAESLIYEALNYYPELMGVKRQLGLRFFEATEKWYISKMKSSLQLFTSIKERIPSNSVDTSHTDICQNYRPETIGDYQFEAEKWLNMAYENSEDEDGTVSMCLAKLYGLRQREEQMLKYLKQALYKKHSYKIESETELLLYLPACSNTECLNALAAILNIKMPLSKDDVMNILKSREKSLSKSADFLVMYKVSQYEYPKPRLIGYLRVFCYDDRFQILWEKDQWQNNPLVTEPADCRTDMDNMWETINKRFWVIMLAE